MAEIKKLDLTSYISAGQGFPLSILTILGVKQVLRDSDAFHASSLVAKSLFKEQYESIFSFQKHLDLDHYNYQGSWKDLPIEDLLRTFIGIKGELDAVNSAGESGGIEFLGDIRQEESSFEDFLPIYRLWVKLNSCFSMPGNGQEISRALTVIRKDVPQPLFPSRINRGEVSSFFTALRVVAW
jgi:hypothetical protein